MMRHPAELHLLTTNDLLLRLQSRLIELSSYNTTFALGDGAWQI